MRKHDVLAPEPTQKMTKTPAALQDLEKLEGTLGLSFPPGLESEHQRLEAIKAAEERGKRALAARIGKPYDERNRTALDDVIC